MRMPIMTTFLIFIAILTFQIKRSERDKDRKENEFWERERRANFTRKKDIEGLAYIPFSMSMIPIHSELQDIMAAEYIQALSDLEGKRIFNCTGKSNTDLKLEYGAPNITKLTEYDMNYTVLVRNIARLAEKYIEAASSDNCDDPAVLLADARTLLEYGISIGSDVRLGYELLGRMYADEGRYDKIDELKKRASALNSLSKDPIIRSLDSLLPG